MTLAPLTNRAIRRSTAALDEAPEAVEFDTPVEFTRDATLAPVERADGPRTYRCCIAVWDSPDSHGDSFTRDSIVTDIPAKGIPLIVGHRRSEDPVGSVVALSNEDDGAYAEVQFASTPRGQEVETLVREGHYRAVSFGGAMLSGYDNAATGGRVGTLARVDELSLTAFPADPGAVFDIVREAVAAVTEAENADEPEAEAENGDVERADRTHGQIRELLHHALTAEHDTDDDRTTYIWVRDVTDEWVVWEIETGENAGLYQATYDISDTGDVAFGDAVEVEARTEYVARESGDVIARIGDPAAVDTPESDPTAASETQPATVTRTSSPTDLLDLLEKAS